MSFSATMTQVPERVDEEGQKVGAVECAANGDEQASGVGRTGHGVGPEALGLVARNLLVPG